MNLPNHAPHLDAPESDWADYLDSLSEPQLSDAHGIVIQFGIKNPEQAKFVEKQRAMIETRMVHRFAGLVERTAHLESRIKILEGALVPGAADLANLPLQEVR